METSRLAAELMKSIHLLNQYSENEAVPWNSSLCLQRNPLAGSFTGHSDVSTTERVVRGFPHHHHHQRLKKAFYCFCYCISFIPKLQPRQDLLALFHLWWALWMQGRETSQKITDFEGCYTGATQVTDPIVPGPSHIVQHIWRKRQERVHCRSLNWARYTNPHSYLKLLILCQLSLRSLYSCPCNSLSHKFCLIHGTILTWS